jgi:cell division protein FtsA
LSAGIVITGGGSLVKNICPLAAQVLGMDAKIGQPSALGGGMVQEVSSPIYATAVGLVQHAIAMGLVNSGQTGQGGSQASGKSMEVWSEGFLGRMKKWVSEL